MRVHPGFAVTVFLCALAALFVWHWLLPRVF
jgi:hypothetical protein